MDKHLLSAPCMLLLADLANDALLLLLMKMLRLLELMKNCNKG